MEDTNTFYPYPASAELNAPHWMYLLACWEPVKITPEVVGRWRDWVTIGQPGADQVAALAASDEIPGDVRLIAWITLLWPDDSHDACPVANRFHPPVSLAERLDLVRDEAMVQSVTGPLRQTLVSYLIAFIWDERLKARADSTTQSMQAMETYAFLLVSLLMPGQLDSVRIWNALVGSRCEPFRPDTAGSLTVFLRMAMRTGRYRREVVLTADCILQRQLDQAILEGSKAAVLWYARLIIELAEARRDRPDPNLLKAQLRFLVEAPRAMIVGVFSAEDIGLIADELNGSLDKEITEILLHLIFAGRFEEIRTRLNGRSQQALTGLTALQEWREGSEAASTSHTQMLAQCIQECRHYLRRTQGAWELLCGLPPETD